MLQAAAAACTLPHGLPACAAAAAARGLLAALRPHAGVQQLARALHASSSCSTASASSSTATTSSSSGSDKNVKGALPVSGPPRQALRALPFTVSRGAAEAAFNEYHSRAWYQSRQRPVLAAGKPFKETYLPFWVGSGAVHVEVRGAEVGHQHLVTRFDRAKGRAEPRWETVWSRVTLHQAWERELAAEEPAMQLYASWRYNRRDVEALRPGPLLQLARPITPDMLQATRGSGHDTRRVGPFTLEPARARRLLMAAVEAQERQRAETLIAKLTGAQHVRFIDLHCTWHGSTGAAPSAPSGSRRGGLDLAPVYLPAYVFSWWHGGAKVRTFVSGVDASSVTGVQVLDDTKLATLAAASTASVGLLLGLSLPALFYGAFVVPFVAAGLVTRFWPLLRSTATSAWQRLQRWWGAPRSSEHDDYCDVDWSSDYVRAYEAYEARQRRAEQQQAYWQQHQTHGRGRGAAGGGAGAAGGGAAGGFGDGAVDPFELLQRIMRDPFAFFERQYARQQQQKQQHQQYRSQQQQQYGGGQQQRQQQRQGGGGGSASADPRDPRGYYAALGVAPGASTQEVSAAFRGLALQHHPDRVQGDADKAAATARFQRLTEAYQVLRDPRKRAAYDAGGGEDRA